MPASPVLLLVGVCVGVLVVRGTEDTLHTPKQTHDNKRTRAQLPEVFGRARRLARKQHRLDPARALPFNADVQKHERQRWIGAQAQAARVVGREAL
jgi:hypothetical protein